jgi:hypothetical protein
MTHPRAQALIEDYGTTTWLIHHLTDDLTQTESLLQPPFEANCLNWVVGHIVNGRNSALKVLGQSPVWDEAAVARYKTGSDPIRGPGCGERSLDALLADLDAAAQRIAAALATMSEADLARLVKTDRGVKSVAHHVAGLHWHETYHTGQLELLRALALSQRKQ